jgi:hypothetical protein
MKQPPAPPPRITVSARFRAEIERAASDGVDLDDLALHLTLGDVELLKRDRSLALPDLNFAGGTMRFLGVKVVKGDTPASVLKRPVTETA